MTVAAFGIGYAGQGGFYEPTQRAIAGLLVAATFASWHAGQTTPRDVTRALAWPGVALCGWVGFSAAVNGAIPQAAGAEVLIVGIAGVCSLVRGLGAEDRDSLAVALVALGCVVAITGWIGLVGDGSAWVHTAGIRRASTSLTYPNAAAGLLSPLALMAIARVVVTRTVGAHIGTCVLLVGLAATLSRGGILSFTVGLVVLGVMFEPPRLFRATAPGIVGAGVALVGLLPAFSAAPSSPWRSGLALVLGIAITAVLAERSSRVLAVVAGTGLILVALGIVLGTGCFLTDSGRWSLASPDRHTSIAVALDVGFDHPLVGTGPGQAFVAWTDTHGDVLVSRFAHNEYAQTFAELGATGLLLVLALLASTATAIWRHRQATPVPQLSAAALAALMAFAIHSNGDFLWRLPALPLTLAAITGLGLPRPDRPALSPAAAAPATTESNPDDH